MRVVDVRIYRAGRGEGLPAVDRSIELARRGSREALGEAIESFRRYLMLVAERELGPAVRAKEGASDVVQETMLEAQRAFGRFEGRTEGELRAWLRTLLLHKVAHTVRRYRAGGKRAVGREVSLSDTGGNGDGLAMMLAADTTTCGTRLARSEEEAHLRSALDRLPLRERTVVLWRHRDALSFDEMGRRLGCSNVAARKAWLKAIQLLKTELGAEDGRDGTARQ